MNDLKIEDRVKIFSYKNVQIIRKDHSGISDFADHQEVNRYFANYVEKNKINLPRLIFSDYRNSIVDTDQVKDRSVAVLK